jgi:hypothetical protein
MQHIYKSKLLSILLSLALVLSLFSGLGLTAAAVEDSPAAPDAAASEPLPDIAAVEDDVSAPQPWPPNNTITVGGEYTMPTTLASTTVTIRTPDPVTAHRQGLFARQRFHGHIYRLHRPGREPLASGGVYLVA